MQAGDIALVRTGGLIGRLIRVVTRSRYNHIRLILDEHGSCIEANPTGCEYGFVQPGDVIVIAPLLDGERDKIADIAKEILGTPYGFLDVVALGLSQFGFKPRWARRRIENPETLFCSQLIDYAWKHVGYDAFPATECYDVSPGDLGDLAFVHGWPIEGGPSMRDVIWN
ncbi:hypothetical protein [Micromonospora sp. NPDC049240]|uniref:hypothetical protein n=1 Tax=Micromonospora sp. NPDC049240 TaxID=3155151 RepID=UPI0033C0AA4A